MKTKFKTGDIVKHPNIQGEILTVHKVRGSIVTLKSNKFRPVTLGKSTNTYIVSTENLTLA